MKRTGLIVAAALCLGAVSGRLSAETYQWCGAQGALMTANGVWSNVVTGAKATIANEGGDYANTIVFDCAALGTNELTVVCPNDGWKLGNLRVLNGTVTVTSVYNISRFFNFGNLTNELHVADGATLFFQNGPSLAGPYYGATNYATVVKTGGGTLKTTGNSRIGGTLAQTADNAPKHPYLKSFYFKEGVLDWQSSGDAIQLATDFRIGPGQTLTLNSNAVQNDTVVHVEAGGTLNLPIDTLGAVVGEGTVNAETYTCTMPTNLGPFVAAGRFSGTIQVDGTAEHPDRHYLLASPDAFAGVTFTPSAVSGAAQLQFAPGVGTFAIGRYVPVAGQPLHLEDAAGNPVTVYAGASDTTLAYTSGSGSLYLNDGQGHTYLKSILGHTGTLGVTNNYGNVTLGDGTAANDVDLAAYAGFDVVGAYNTIKFMNAAAHVVPGAVRGAGTIEAGGAPLTFTDFAMSGGTLKAAGDVTLQNVSGTLNTINYAADGVSVTLAGGSLAALPTSHEGCVNVIGGKDAALNVSNALLRAMNMSVRSVNVVDGGTLWLLSAPEGSVGQAEKLQTFTFDGAALRLGKVGNGSFDSQLKTVTDGAPYRVMRVGPGGMEVRIDFDGKDFGSGVGAFLSGAAAGETDGGVTVRGRGWLRVDGSWADLSGPVRILGTQFQPKAGDTFGLTGDVELGTTRIYFNTRCDSAFATRSGAKVTLSGLAALDVYRASSSSYSTFTLGPADAAADASIAWVDGGVLALVDRDSSSSLFDGTWATPAVKVNGGGLTPGENGLVKFPAFAFTNNKGTDRGMVEFLTYDAEKGFVETKGTAWGEQTDAAAPVYVDSGANVAANADVAVGGLCVVGRGGDALTIAKGVTVTVGAGSAPAMLLLNNTHAAGRGAAQIGGAGTLDFGARAGVVAVNKPQSGMNPAIVNAVLAGTGGITFAGVPDENALVRLGAANTYSGGTHVLGLTVQAAKAGCFGPGAVTVANGLHSGGGVLFTASGTWPNAWTVMGCGAQRYASHTGVLGFQASDVRLTGSVTLADETFLATGGASNKGTFEGPISGVADLTTKGAGTIVFAAVNTYRGTTTVGEGGTLVLKGAGTLGDGPVVLEGATLRFENASDVVITNAVSGTGAIVAAGSGKVRLLNAASFTGTYEAKGSGVFDLNGADVEQETLIGSGTYANSGAAATLTVSNTALSAFSGTIGGAIAFVKTGAGVQTLSGNNTYEGATTVNAGTLAVGAPTVAGTLPVTNALLHLDADVGVTCEEESDRVAGWADADGRDFSFLNMNYQSLATPNAATYLADHVNGHAVLHFDHSNIRLQAAGKACGVRTYFHVVAWGHDGAPRGNLDGIFGKGNADSGVRINNSGPVYGDTQDDAVNGAGTTVPVGTFHVFRREYASAADFASPSVGDYSQYKRPFGGDIAEIVAYDRTLNATETDAVTEYLMVKWGVAAAPEAVRKTDVLPATTDLVVDEGATVQLNDVDQTVATLSGSGTISNATSVASVLTVASDSAFAGTFAAGVNLVVKAGATFTLVEGAVLDAGMTVTLEEGATLDLGGQTFVIRTLRGWSKRQVRNGTLVERHPWVPATVLLFK